MIRYLITDGTARSDAARLINRIGCLLVSGIDFIQIREPQLTGRELAAFTREVTALPNPNSSRILVNDRADIALASGAHGVHLRDGSLLPEEFAALRLVISVSCHSAQDALEIRGADFILLAPVFAPLSKIDLRPPLGLPELSKAARHSRTPILALGGVTTSNASLCLDAGAAGIAGISFFQ